MIRINYQVCLIIASHQVLHKKHYLLSVRDILISAPQTLVKKVKSKIFSLKITNF